MTCKDCINLEPNTEHCNCFDMEVDTKAYRLCTEAKLKDDTETDDCWESVSK